MPPWLTALLVLFLISGLGAYMVYREGFVTAETECKNTFNSCTAACSPTNGACLTDCGTVQTKCLSNAVAAATIANTGALNGPFMNSSMAWAASLGSGMLGNTSNTRSNGYMPWSNSAGSSTSIPTYNATDTSRVYRQTGWDSSIWGPRSPSSTAQAPTTKTPTTQAPTTKTPTTQAATAQAPTAQAPTTQAPTSDWDGNRDKYTTGWPQQNNTLQNDNDDSYDANSPTEGSYVVSVKRWKPHETPTQQAPAVKANAPTDAGTKADELRDQIPSLQQNVRNDVYITDDIVPNSIRGLINEDVKDTMDALFRNQYEITYS